LSFATIGFDPITAVSCRAKDHPLSPPSNLFRPRRNPLLEKRAWVEAPGTAPGSERPIPMPIYRHSRPRGQQPTYKAWEAGREEGAWALVARQELVGSIRTAARSVAPQHLGRFGRMYAKPASGSTAVFPSASAISRDAKGLFAHPSGTPAFCMARMIRSRCLRKTGLSLCAPARKRRTVNSGSRASPAWTSACASSRRPSSSRAALR
jgi:hypothetical protein